MSRPERLLWSRLRNAGCYGVRFRRQHPIGPFVADFYCDAASLVVEVDSSFHSARREHDAARDAWMTRRGIEVVRIPAYRIMDRIDDSVLAIASVVKRRMDHLRPGSFDEAKREFLERRRTRTKGVRPDEAAGHTVRRRTTSPLPNPPPRGAGEGDPHEHAPAQTEESHPY